MDGFDRASGRVGTVGREGVACSAIVDVVGRDDEAVEVAGTPRSQGFGGETIVVWTFVVAARSRADMVTALVPVPVIALPAPLLSKLSAVFKF